MKVFSKLTGLFFFLYSSFLAGYNSFAQIPVIQWDKTLGGNHMDILFSLNQTTDGGYILGGTSFSGISGDKTMATKGGTGDQDCWIVKVDANGNRAWDKTFGGNSQDELIKIIQTTDGGYIFISWSSSGISGDKTGQNLGGLDYWIVKLDANGNKLWDKTFGGSGSEFSWDIQQTMDGGYLLGGTSESGISGSKTEANKGAGDYWILKTDGSGNKLWDKTIGGSGDDNLNSLQATSDGGFILGGSSESDISGDKSEAKRGIGTYDSDYWVVKLNGSGIKQWDKTYGGSLKDELLCINETIDGGFILGGNSYSSSSFDKTDINQGISSTADYWVIKLNSTGNKQWDKTFGGSAHERFTNIEIMSNGGYLIGGSSLSGISGAKSEVSRDSLDYWMVKIDGSGNKVWDKTVGGNQSDYLLSFKQTSDGGFLLGGFSESGISGEKTGNDKGSGDFWIVKLAGTITGIINEKYESAISVYPNPNKGNFNFQLNNPEHSDAIVSVTDLAGRKVWQKEILINNSRLTEQISLPQAKGMYLLQVKTGDQTITKKILVE